MVSRLRAAVAGLLWSRCRRRRHGPARAYRAFRRHPDRRRLRQFRLVAGEAAELQAQAVEMEVGAVAQIARRRGEDASWPGGRSVLTQPRPATPLPLARVPLDAGRPGGNA